MRINVYEEELTHDIKMIRKHNVIGEDGLPHTYYGLRIYLEGSDSLHNTPDDDDRSAITFWSRFVNGHRLMIDDMKLALHDYHYESSSSK